MTEKEQQQLGKILWDVANELRGTMDADDFRDYMLSLLFLSYLSDNYLNKIKKLLGNEYPKIDDKKTTPLQQWYASNPNDIKEFEKDIKKKLHYTIKPQYLWDSIVNMAKSHDDNLLSNLHNCFKHIEEDSFNNNFQGLFSEIRLDSEKLGKSVPDKNKKLCGIISKIADGLEEFSTETDKLGDAYEYLLGEFASGSGKKAGEFYTPQKISKILSSIVILDSQNPKEGRKKKLNNIFDFACGSGSLLLNVRNEITKENGTVGKIYGQEKNITTYNLARMNMLLHSVKDTEFEIYHGDSLKNDWNFLQETNPAKKPKFDAIVANPPFSLRWDSDEAMGEDVRFKNYGLAPKSAADFAFLLHGFNFLTKDGVMAIILPHGVLFRSGAEARIRQKLINDGNIDTIISLPSNLFYSTGIPVCILVLKKCKKDDDILFINASDEENFKKEKRQNTLRDEDITKIVETYKFRKEKDRYSKRISLAEIEKNDFNLNISRYISTAKPEEQIDIKSVNKTLAKLEKNIIKQKTEHNNFLKELGLSLLP